MRTFTARELALICVVGVTLACAGCYKPATGNNTGSTSAVVLLPPATPSPTVAPSASPSAITTASPSATSRPNQLAAAVDAALRNPTPNLNPGATGTAGSRSPGSRSPVRKTDRTKVLAAPEANGGTRGITFDDLVFPIEVGQNFEEKLLTDHVRDLFGKKVKLRGYIHPSCTQMTGVTSFIFVRDDQSCCFGPKALLYDCIIIDMVPGRSTNYTLKPIAVEGTLTLREFKDLDGKHLAIFHLDGEAVE